jgi:hypothetical protein
LTVSSVQENTHCLFSLALAVVDVESVDVS